MKKTHDYNNYDEYVAHQLEKTSNKEKQAKWFGPEWQEKITIFKKLFKDNIQYLENKKNAICLGSRTGQEVIAFKEQMYKNALVLIYMNLNHTQLKEIYIN